MLKSSVPESSNIFVCENCHYMTSRLSQFNRHITTTKHQKSTFCQQSSTEINTKSSVYECYCGKIYKERTGLWRHKKVCKFGSEKEDINEQKNTFMNFRYEIILF